MSYCEQCGQQYEAKRSTSKYCGASCRKLAFQVSVPKLSVPEVSENAKTLHEINCEARGVNACNTVWLPPQDLPPHTVNRVSLPGDIDYKGVWDGD